MSKQFYKDGVGWGFIIWLIGYALGFALFAFVPSSIIGWIIMPAGVAITLWVLFKKVRGDSFQYYVLLAVVWTIIALVFDYFLLVKALKPVDGYYKLDVYLYYILTFIFPLVVGWYKTRSVNMKLSSYHQKYINKSDEELAQRADVKYQELKQIFSQVKLLTNNDPLKIAVMGCGDKRFVQYHNKYFTELFGKGVELTTFDISIEHLIGEKNIILHDCTTPLPNPPYDLTYAHVLLKFIPTEKQWDVIQNSYTALSAGGIAIHVLDSEDYSGKELADGLYSVPLQNWEDRLTQNNIEFKKILLKSGPSQNMKALAMVLIKTI